MMLLEKTKTPLLPKSKTLKPHPSDMSANKSCPKTPNHLVCSEGLSLRLAVSSESEGDEEEEQKESGKIAGLF